MADLSGYYFDIIQGTLNAGDSFDIDFGVQNTDFNDAGPFYVDFYLSNDTSIDSSDYLLNRFDFSGGLLGSLSEFNTIALTLPDETDPFWFGDGTYTVGMIVDGADEVVEFDETNNSNVGFLVDNDDVDITVTTPPPPPTDISLDRSTVNENQPAGTIVGNLSTTDLSAGDTHTYTLVTGTGDTDNSAFTIEGNVLKTKQSFDFEVKDTYSIRVETEDSVGNTYEEVLTINVNDVLDGTPATAPPAINFEPLDLKLRGDGEDNVLKGGKGNDRIRGKAGNDRLVGKGGNDQLFGQRGDDVLIGGKGNDLLNGGAGNDRLLGRAGDDVLVGGKGIDALTGGNGKDLFVFNNLMEAGDRITDFSGTDELIDLRTLFAAPQYNGATASEQLANFVQLVQMGANTEVRIDTDGNGVGTALTTLVTLENVAANTISAGNFVIA